MKRVACLVFLTLLLSLTGVISVWAEEPLPPKLQQLTEEAYRHYSARETDNYFEAIEKVKEATEFSPYQETYYRACAYEAQRRPHQDVYKNALITTTVLQA